MRPEDGKQAKTLTADVLRCGRRFLAMPHIYIDGDDLGCMLALRAALESMGKECVLYAADPIPSVYSYLPELDTVSGKPPQGPFDAILLLECSSLGRIDPNVDIKSLGGVLINIDHHVDNDYFADINWVDPEASALGELAYDLITELQVPLDYRMAVSLYTSIFSDTGSFQYRRVSTHTHEIVADLLRFPVPLDEIARRIYREKPWGYIKLEGMIINAMQLSSDGRVAWSEVSQAMLAETGVSEEDTQYAIELVSQVRGTEVHLLFKESKDGRIKVSFRSNGAAINHIAGVFGGGGHKLAAGCALHCSLEEAKRRVLSEVMQALGQDVPATSATH